MPSSPRVAPPRVSHSFPTRRSSDLTWCLCQCSSVSGKSSRWCAPLLSARASAARVTHSATRRMLRRSCRSIHSGSRPRFGNGSCAQRSEEHTSELQSLRQLVCRLLLASPPPACLTLSLHDALPISPGVFANVPRSPENRRAGARPCSLRERALRASRIRRRGACCAGRAGRSTRDRDRALATVVARRDRKSTRLNSSHLGSSYAVFSSRRPPPRVSLFPYTTLFRSHLVSLPMFLGLRKIVALVRAPALCASERCARHAFGDEAHAAQVVQVDPLGIETALWQR